jgi:hypothetical protein
MRATRWSGSGLVLVVTFASVGAACAKGSGEQPLEPRTDDRPLLGAFDGVLIERGTPQAAPQLFAQARDQGLAAPCLVEPEPGTLFPRNWLPPRFTWTTGSMANLFELRIRTDKLPTDLVVYTSGWSWTMPADLWGTLQSGSGDVPLKVELRAALYDGRGIRDVTSANHADLGIAPVEAPGSIVYWSLGSGREASRLRGLTMVSEGVFEVLSPNDMPARGENDRSCIGCHTATPDGKDVAVAWEHATGGFSSDLARIEKNLPTGPRPTYVSPEASTILGKRTRTLSAFSRAHWTAGDRLMVTNDDVDLVWVDLEATTMANATGTLGHHGDPNERRLGPAWTRDGSTIVYMSGTLGAVPSEFTGPSDLYVMPFADRTGATEDHPAAPIPGASSPSSAEYYPTLSPDDAWIAFNALPDNGRLYDNPASEIFIAPRDGGERVRLRANDPPSCAARPSPGISNSWAKWAPAVQERNGRKYYFVVFSSRRHLKTAKPQLYVAPIVVEANGAVTSFPAVYLRSQESLDGWEGWGNHTPAWDDFVIEPPPSVK